MLKNIFITILVISFVKKTSTISFDMQSVLPLTEVAHFDEGLLYGVTSI